MVVPGAQFLLGGEQLLAQREVDRDNPLTTAEREASRTRFEGLDTAPAAALVKQTFPDVVDHLEGGPPLLSAGERLVGYPTDHAAQLLLPGDKHVLVESAEPMAVADSQGGRSPIDLSLEDSGGAFQPGRAGVGVRIPKRLGEGVSLPEYGLSLTPVSGNDQPLSASEGESDGASVFYGGSGDTDMLVKPTASGFEEDTFLTSVKSPRQLSFQVGLPVGTSLVRSGRSGALQVIAAGRAMAAIPAPTATDAEGMAVPVSMTVIGDTLTLTVGHQQGDYRYPIVVDPTVVATTATSEGWEYESKDGPTGKWSGEILEDTVTPTRGAEVGQTGLWGFEAPGESDIYEFVSETSSTASNAEVENQLAIVKPPGVIEKSVNFGSSYGPTKTEVCTQAGCATGKVESGNKGNIADFQQVVIKAVEGGSGSFTTKMSASVYLLQEKGPSTSFNLTSPTISGHPNVLYTKSWLGPANGAFEATGTDPGLGIDESLMASSGGWKLGGKLEKCVKCYPESKATVIGGGGLPEGEDTIEYTAKDPVGLSSNTATATVKVDDMPPYGITLTGLPPNKEIGGGLYHLKATAKDGSGTTPSSGVESLVLKVDGVQVGSTGGGCTPGPCTASDEWTVTGSNYAAGAHELTVTATDYAGNVATEKYTLYVARPTKEVAVGPGQLNPQSGELSLNSTDVSIPAADSSLSVGRSYGSLHLTEGATGPLGPQWILSLGSTVNLTKLPDGDMLLTNGVGLQAVFATKGSGEFTAPKGDASLVLSEKTVGGKVQFTLKEGAGNVTTFTLASGGEGNLWLPTSREQANGLNVSTVSYQTVGSVTEPTELLAPKPVGVSSCATLVKGCRALQFVYSTKTTATGDAQSEWGEYEGRLKEITFTAWEPITSKMATIAVAHYEYDKEGKLRAAWDPRVTPTVLKTTYGYDAAGHVTAVTEPGQQPWLFTYGTVAGDARNGRLIAVTRPSASTAAGNGIAPTNTAAPAISGTVEIGKTLSVSTGTWNNSPLSYEYQWETCNSTGGECTALTGATNPTLVVPQAAAAHKLVVKVTATNSDGSGTLATTATSEVKKPVWYFHPFGALGSGNGQFSAPTGIVTDSKGNVWVVDGGNNRLEEFGANGEFMATYGSAGAGADQFSKPTGIAINPKTSDIYVSDAGNHRVDIFGAEGKFVEAFGWGVKDGKAEFEKCTTTCQAGTSGEGKCQFEEPTGIAFPEKEGVGGSDLVVMDSKAARFDYFNATLTFCGSAGVYGSGTAEFVKPQGVGARKASPEEEMDIADSGNNRVQDWGTQFFEYLAAFGSAGTGEGKFSSPWGIAEDPSQQLIRVVDSGNNRVETFSSTSRTYKGQFGSEGTGNYGQFKTPEWIAEGIQGTAHDLYITDNKNNRVVEASEHSLPDAPIPPTPPNPGTSAVTTIEYHVPLVGAEAPYQMNSTEVGKWAQTDTPSEATAVFPPDEPEGWPAKDYKRATVFYLDSLGNTINVAESGGGIATIEYNSSNDVVRTLSPDNRAKALSEGSSSATVAKALDSESAYAEEGTELESTLGPEHKVALPGGSEVNARARARYSYNEGAPSEGGPYRLVTKETDAAEVAGKEDVRTTSMSYAAQEGLGWKLRKPTSTVIDPGGLQLTHSASYEPATGSVAEITSPLGVIENALPAYALKFGAGHVTSPGDIAVDSAGNVWVADTSTDKVDKFSSAGTFIAAYGEEGSSETKLQFKAPLGIAINQTTGNVYVGDGANNRVVELSSAGALVRVFGKAGTGKGEFKEPGGVALDSKGNVWVTDRGNNRIQEFSETGTWLKEFGSTGTEGGRFSGPIDIAISGEDLYVTDSKNSRVEEFKEEGKTLLREWGTSGTANGQFKTPGGITVGPNGNVFVADSGNARVQEFSATGTFVVAFGASGSGLGQMSKPEGIAAVASGALYVADTGNSRLQVWVSNKGGAHTSQTIYYSAEANTKYPSCGIHAEWAGLPCQTQPAKQPETEGLPGLPVTTYTYNIWNELEKSVETVGATTRTDTVTYDGAGRVTGSAAASTAGTALPSVSYEYDSKLGLPTVTSTESKAKKITTVYNSLGQVASYTDTDGNTASYSYDVDGRVEKLSDTKGSQTYTYDPTTGFLTKLVDSAAGTFTASYDSEGNMTSEGLPNGMEIKYGYDAAGNRISQEDIKSTDCSSKCVWFSDSVVPSIHGQWVAQTSTLSHQAYGYDKDGRLIEVQDTPTGGGCTTRLYTYDEDTNRTTMTTRAPGTEGKCATSGGSTEVHLYDTADRLLDTGTAYSTFGDITALPAGDAGGSELSSAYYVDNQAQSQTQNGQTIGYNLDPISRVRETVSTGKIVATVTNHFDGGASEPAWSSEVSGKWTRYISGIGGGLEAIEYNGESPVLQLSNLHGDLVATVSLSETATGLESTNDTTEYGVPRTGTPPKFSWLGAHELPTELPSGVMEMGVRSYVPQVGRFLQPDPIPGGSADAYAYTFGDPVNTSDPSGAFAAWFKEFASNNAAEIVVAAAAREKAAREEAERKAREAEEAAEASRGGEEGEGGEEWGEEEWEEESEYVSYRHRAEGEASGRQEVEYGSLFQPVPEGDGASKSEEPVGHFLKVSAGCPEGCYGKKPAKKAPGGKKGASKKKSKPSCPKGYIYIPILKMCAGFEFELPTKNTPVPVTPPEPVPVP
jgi:RHS repeat-associated protein